MKTVDCLVPYIVPATAIAISKLPLHGLTTAGCCCGFIATVWSVFRGRRVLQLNDRVLSMNDTSMLTRCPRLLELVIDTAVVDSAFVTAISSLRKLHTLVLRRVVVNDAGLDLSFLSSLSELKTLVLDACPRLSDQNFSSIAHLNTLEHLYLRIRKLDTTQQLFIKSSSARDVSLCLYGPQDAEALSSLPSIESITHLEFYGFERMEFPAWLKDFKQLKSLTFQSGTLVFSHQSSHCVLPQSLQDLSLVDCSVDSITSMNNILSSGENLTRLYISSVYVPATLAVDRCPNLVELEILGKEIDEGVLERVALLPHLEILQLSGCHVLDDVHVRYLAALKKLKRLSIKKSATTETGWTELRLLQKFRDLIIDFDEGNTAVDRINDRRSHRRVSVDFLLTI